MAFELSDYLEYFTRLPNNKYIDSIKSDELDLMIFDAYEDITTLYPEIDPTPRMIYKQVEFKIESEQTGVGYMQRQGIETQKINDASITFKGDMLSPYVLDLIHNELGTRKLRIGRLI